MNERKIGGSLVRAQPIEAREALALFLRTCHIIGPGLAHLDRMIDGSEEERDAAAVMALAAITLATDVDDLTRFIVSTVETAQMRVNGAYDDILFDIHLGGDLVLAFKIFGFVLETNFGGLFEAARNSPLAERILALRNEVHTDG